MLTQVNYNNLWTVNLGLPIQTIPCYYQYLQREVYFQDYLDLFCCPENGEPTNERLVIQGHQTVSVQGLQADPSGEFTVIDSKGDVRLIVEYDFPFDEKKICKGREIKYILIGEAAHSISPTYFYNISHIQHTHYFSQPLRAFGQVNGNKTIELLSLADAGILLIDLLPYNINYSQVIPGNITLRRSLCDNGNIQTFWDNVLNPYSVSNRLTLLVNCLDNDWDLSLMAPCELSLCLLNLGPIVNAPNGLHTLNFRTLDANNALRCIRGRDYLKITINSANQGPSASLIRRSFGLPII
jgi:hypothetical protein